MAEAAVIARSPYPLTVDMLTEQFAACGLQPGNTVSIHIAMSTLGWVVGGPVSVIQALLRVLGPSGTLMMPTQTWKNLDPASGVHPVPEAWWPVIRESWPAYDPAITPSIGMGVVAELFRTWPGAIRSNHPVRSFAALGSRAAWLMADHQLENALGDTSPLGKLYDADGMILLIGLDHGSNTSLHLAEHRAQYPGKQYVQESSAILVAGQRRWVTYSSLALQSDDFATIGADYEAAYGIPQHHVGQAVVRFLRQRPLVDWAVQWMEHHRNQPPA